MFCSILFFFSFLLEERMKKNTILKFFKDSSDSVLTSLSPYALRRSICQWAWYVLEIVLSPPYYSWEKTLFTNWWIWSVYLNSVPDSNESPTTMTPIIGTVASSLEIYIYLSFSWVFSPEQGLKITRAWLPKDIGYLLHFLFLPLTHIHSACCSIQLSSIWVAVIVELSLLNFPFDNSSFIVIS